MEIKIFFTIMGLLLSMGCLQEKFSGITPQPNPAPDFILNNQFGEKVSLSDFKGKIIVMSFLYTSCPTVCPLITGKFVDAAKKLEKSKNDNVIFLGISVDPERDTIEAVNKYIETKDLRDMQFLIGTRDELEIVWEYYNIYVNKSGDDESNDYEIDHTAIVYVIDKNGDLRILYPGLKWYPKFLVSDINTLLKEENFLFKLIYDIPNPEK
jgi:protein SCO1/2|tara:strand:+ start:5071 stop:5700 length:630 start_codon:yes stop_codon:yes gene_type:complete